MMKNRWLFWVGVGAVALIALAGFVWGLKKQNQVDALEEANNQQRDQFILMREMQQKDALAIQQLIDSVGTLDGKTRIVNSTANASLAEIAKLKQREKERHEEVDNLPDADVNSIILDGLSKYKAKRHGTGEGADPR